MTFPITLNNGDRLRWLDGDEEKYFLATQCEVLEKAEDFEKLTPLTKEEFEELASGWLGDEEEYSTGYSFMALIAMFIFGLVLGLAL